MLSHDAAASLAGNHSFLRILKEAQERDREKQARILSREAEQLKSLRIPQDDRYKRMERFKDSGRSRGATAAEAEEQFLGVVVNRAADPLPAASGQMPRRKIAGVDERAEWTECFDRKIRSLMVDFQLTDDPTARLKHLDQMHNWFEAHGGKHARRAGKAPQYLTAERDGEALPGSTRCLPGLSSTSNQLASVYSPRTFEAKKRSGIPSRFPSLRK